MQHTISTDAVKKTRRLTRFFTAVTFFENEGKQFMSPASYVIRVLGGVRPTARMLSRNPSSVSRWKFSVPVGLHKKILYLARVKNLDITPNDLVYGRKTK